MPVRGLHLLSSESISITVKNFHFLTQLKESKKVPAQAFTEKMFKNSQ